MVDRTRVAERARERRRAIGLRREDVAVRAGVSSTTVDNLEQGKRLPRIETLDRIAEVLGVPLADLLAARSQLAVAA